MRSIHLARRPFATAALATAPVVLLSACTGGTPWGAMPERIEIRSGLLERKLLLLLGGERIAIGIHIEG